MLVCELARAVQFIAVVGMNGNYDHLFRHALVEIADQQNCSVHDHRQLTPCQRMNVLYPFTDFSSPGFQQERDCSTQRR